jgi:hypothetical protein
MYPQEPIDAKAEAKLRLKIDLWVVPTTTLLYLFCFIDRTNIGMINSHLQRDLY